MKLTHVDFTDRERAAIRCLHANYNLSTRDIGNAFGVSSGCVSYWLRSLRDPKKPTAPAPSPSRKRQMEKRRDLVRRLAPKVKVLRDADGSVRRRVPLYHSASAIVTALARDHCVVVSKQTVLRDLRACGFVSRVRHRSTSTTTKDAVKRVLFAKRILRKKNAFFRKLVFTDEKIFTSNDCTSRRMWVTDAANVLPLERRRWPVGRVLVWICVGVGFRKMVIFPERQHVDGDGDQKCFRLTAPKYVRYCLSPIARDLFCQGRVYQQDGAGCHKVGFSFLEQRNVECLTNWPPRSPQLSPAETVWAVLQPRVADHHPRDRLELVAAVRQEWEALAQSTIDKTVLTFRTRLKCCVQKRGLL